MKATLTILATGVWLAATSAQADEPWEFSFSPYIWAASVHGSLETSQRTVDFDAGFGDIISNLDFTLMGTGEVRKGAWGFIADFIYLDVSNSASTPRGELFSKVDVELTSIVGTGALAYRAFENKTVALDALVAFRVWSLSSETTLKQGLLPEHKIDKGDTWVDPVIGARAKVNITEHWFISGEGDVGGFGVGSELAWQLLGTAGYRFDDRWSLQVGYRHLFVKRDFGEATMKTAFTGPIAGVTFRF